MERFLCRNIGKCRSIEKDALSFPSTDLYIPDVDTLVEGPAGEVLSVGTEGDAVDWLLMPGQRVDTQSPLHVPQPHRRVKRRAETWRDI